MKKFLSLTLFVLYSFLVNGQQCSPISPLDCDQIEKSLPIDLDFTIDNGSILESGFTMVLEPSDRLATDILIADTDVLGYAPSLISKTIEGLSITSTKGIIYSQPVGSPSSTETNSQMNALGSGFKIGTTTFNIETTLVNPDYSLSAGNSSQQAGIWFGLDEDHYVKLVLAKTGTNTKNVHLQVENIDGSSNLPIFSSIYSADIDAATEVSLRMELDPISETVSAYYTLDNGSEIQLVGAQTTLSVPSDYFTGVAYDSNNVTDLLSFSGLFTTQRRAAENQNIDVTFKDFSISEEEIVPELTFNTAQLNFSGEENEAIADQIAILSATEGNPSVTFSDDPDSSTWLILPSQTTLGDVSFGVQSNLPVGTYSTTVFAIDQPDLGYQNAAISINLEILPEGTGDLFTPISINFSNASTAAPTDYEKDSGLGYGDRGNGYNYGWLASDGVTPLDLSSTARNRGYSGFETIENTLIHMQYDDVNSSGTEGVWEIEVPEGAYNVTVGAGDLSVDGSNTSPVHRINVEGQNIINDFLPTGGAGTSTRITSGTGTVIVVDGKLTIDAFGGGFNTKLNYIQIEAVTEALSPVITSLTPEDGATSVAIESSIVTSGIFSPNTDVNGDSGIDANSVDSSTVQLFVSGTTTPIPATIDMINLIEGIEIVPSVVLEYGTSYTVEIDGILDLTGAAFESFTSSFTTIEEGATGFQPISINFSNASTAAPTDYEKDSGLGYGDRGNGYNYGWLASDGVTPLDLSSTARNRGYAGFEVPENTLVHMQYDDVNTTGVEGIWEIEVPEGAYNVTVGAGDLSVDGSNTSPVHRINVEGQNIIDDFLPTGAAGTSTRITSGTGTVIVVDGKLTIDAFGGGFNTKINYIQIEAVTEALSPVITSLTPEDGATSVAIESSIVTSSIFTPNTDINGDSGIDASSVDSSTVQLFVSGTTTPIPATINMINLIEGIEIVPSVALEYGTSYTVEIDGILDLTGAAFEFFTSSFTTIEEGATGFQPISVNFSNASTAAPTDYEKDSGLGYGDRGNGYNYGWLASDGVTPLDLSSTARNRGYAGFEVIVNTFIHMQYDDVNVAGVEGIWEIEVPNGVYSVTIGVGDLSVDGSNTSPVHRINVEGQNIINDFLPTGAAGTSTRISSGSGVVSVVDGKLTIDAFGGGFNTKISYIEIIPAGSITQPYFTDVNPSDQSIDVNIDGFQINVGIIIPEGYELTNSTLAGNVNLYEVDGVNEVLVESNSNDTGGGDAVTLTPLDDLKEFTTYVFRLTSDIEVNRIGDTNDVISFIPFSSTFTTGENTATQPTLRDLTDVEFSRIFGEIELGTGTTNQRFSSLVIGPDGKLYASTIGDFVSDGQIYRWDISPDGTLANLEILSPLLSGAPHPIDGARSNDDRLIVGFVFDPSSTAENLIAYVTHSTAVITDGPEWDGIITRLSGPNLETVEDLVIHLPRSLKDHLTNSMAFDANGLMYFNQASNAAGGAPDPIWGNRPERLLSGATLKLDLSKLTTLPLSVYTTDDIPTINSAPTTGTTMSDGTYNPYSSDSPVTIYASGIRNAYDLVWHSNGWLYIPANGTAGNGTNSPNAPGTDDFPVLAKRIDGLTSIPSVPVMNGGETQKDWLFKTQGGSYHGHPNAYRGEFVLNHGGLSYSDIPGQEVSPYKDVDKYPNSLLPDPNYREPAYDFGENKSPNGVIEYKSDAFGGRLQGLLMVTRFSGQDDLLVMDTDSNGGISEAYSTIPGLSGFDDPLDIIEDPLTGNIYVSEYDRSGDGTPRLTLLRASIPASIDYGIASNPEELIFEITTNGDDVTQETKTIEITNERDDNINIVSASIEGAFASQFNTVQPNGAAVLAPGESIVYTVTYAPDNDELDLGYQDARLEIITDDTTNSTIPIGLFGLKKPGYFGTFEPALQDIVDVLGIGVDVGWTTVDNDTDPTPIGDEVAIDRWVKASEGPVTITPVARYTPAEELPFGWFTVDGGVTTNQVGTLSDGNDEAQTLYPSISSGTSSFDPGIADFGIYIRTEVLNVTAYTDDDVNTDGTVTHKSRIYPFKDREGNPIANKYLIGFEPAFNGDYQDYIFVVDNVEPYYDSTFILDFDKESLAYSSINEDIVSIEEITLTTTESTLDSEEVSLEASEDWVILPTSFSFDTPFDLGVNAFGLEPGNYTATVTATSTGFVSATVDINLTVTDNITYTYQFNFQDPDNVEVSPVGYIDDLGAPYGLQTTSQGDYNFGWVEPGTQTPADASVNARNRNTGTDVLLKTFSLMGHSSFEVYPTLDWIITGIPVGSYHVDISVGDLDNNDSNHQLIVNGVTVIDFDQENSSLNLATFSNTSTILVTNGQLRMSLGAGGVNTKPNYIRFTPVDETTTPPTIVADFDGNLSSTDVYSGIVNIDLAAEDNSGSGIQSLTYSLDENPSLDYIDTITITELGMHSLSVTAVDQNGNTSNELYEFTIEESSGALLSIENMTKIPGTTRGFPADDYYTFFKYDLIQPGEEVYDSNTLRINNTGTNDLIVTGINISDENAFSYELFDSSDVLITLPFTVSAGDYADVSITFTSILGTVGNNLVKESIEIISNADNSINNTATLHGAQQFESNNVELNPQQVFDVFGFQSSMLSYVNDEGTTQPLRANPLKPSEFMPTADNINAGFEGDLILSSTFVQADPTKPVYGIQLAALHSGPSSDGAKFIAASGNSTIGGIDFEHDPSWFNTLLPQTGDGINSDSATSITSPFRIQVVNYDTGGRNDGTLLGVRVYKVIDHNGNIIPNEYIVIQDYIGNGCNETAGSCDFNDNVFYFINIKPENDPSATSVSETYVLTDEAFNLDFESYIDMGYPGNVLEYTATYNGSSELPDWMFFNPNTLEIDGLPSIADVGVYDITINAIDLNGISVSTTVSINVVEEYLNDLPWIEDFSDVSNGAVEDTGDTAWTSTRSSGSFSVEGGEFVTNIGTGTGTWTSESINANGFVSISLDIDDDDNSKEDSDFINAYYRINGETPVLFGGVINNISAQTLSVSDIYVEGTIQIIIETRVSWSDEYYIFDNVSVIESSSSSKGISTKNTTNVLSLDENKIEYFKVFPNPASDYVTISSGSNSELEQIYVYDITGRVVLSVNPKDIKRGEKYVINVSNLNTGTYLLKTNDKEGIINQAKLVVK